MKWYGLVESKHAPGARSRLPDRLSAAVTTLLAIATVIVTAVRLALAGWVPLTDDAVISLRTQDVFSRHIPLVGMPSTLAAYAPGHAASHPGPLEFFVLSVPYALFHRSPSALLAGVAALNIAAIVGIAWGARRLGGTVATTIAMVFVGALIWGIGNGATADVWNPAVALLPFALFLVLSLCVARGDIVVFPALVLAGSFAAQAHLAYVAPVGVVGVWAIATFAVHVRRLSNAEAPAGVVPVAQRRPWIVCMTSAAVFIACWLAPIAQQLGGHNPNVTAIVRGARSNRFPSAGFAFGVTTVGRVVGLPPPFGLRPTANGAATVTGATFADVARFVVPWTLIALGAIVAWRRRDRLAGAGVITAALALVIGAITTMRAPVVPGTHLVFIYNVRFLWPIAMFFWFAVVFAAWQLVGASRLVARRAAMSVEVGCIAVLVIVLLTRTSAPKAPDMELTRDLNSALVAQVHAPGAYVIRSYGGSGLSFVSVSDTVATGIAAALERRGVHAYMFPGPQVTEATWGRRLYTGQHVLGTVWIVSGDGPRPTATARVVGAATATTAGDRALERRLFGQLRVVLERSGVQPTASGRRVQDGRAADSGGGSRAELAAAVRDPVAALTDGSLEALVSAKLIDAPGLDDATLRRYEALRQLSMPAWRVTAYIDGPPG